MTLSELANIGYVFLQDLPDVTVASPGSGEELDVTVEVDGETVLEETMYGDGNGNVNLHDLPDMLEPYIYEGHKTVSINDTAITVYYSKNALDYFANLTAGLFQAWCQRNFLSVNNCKYVAEDEPINVYVLDLSSSNKTVKIDLAFMVNNICQTVSATKSLYISGNTPEKYSTTLQEMKSLTGSQYPIVGMRISVDNRVYEFRKIIGKESCTIKYLNAFGLEEFVSVKGELKKKPSYEFTTAKIYSRTENIAIDQTEEYEFNTSAIDENTVLYLKDALTSRKTQLLRAGYIYDIVFENADLGYTDNRNDLQGVSFSFKKAIKNKMYIDDTDTGKLSRIFSNEFDNSFN